MDNKMAKSQYVLMSSKSDDLKLLEVFEIYKDDIRKEYTDLYYALLGWKDNHLKELHMEQSRK